MKRLKFLLLPVLAITLIGSLKAQDTLNPYLPMLGDTNVWTYSRYPWTFVDTIFAEDSVYNGFIYKKILHNGYPGGCTGLLREDTTARKVWYIEPDSTTERIIYDFSLQEGDSIWLQYNANAYGYMLKDGWYYVDSIRVKTFLGTDRRVFYLDNPLNDSIIGYNSPRPYIEWIEGVGSNLHPTYFVIKDCAADFGGISYESGASIICAFKDNQHIYQDPYFFPPYCYNFTCFTHTDIKDISQNKLIEIFPNPVKDELTVKFENNCQKNEIYLLDIYGNTLKHIRCSDNNLRINVSDLTSGIYFISIRGENRIINRKFIKF